MIGSYNVTLRVQDQGGTWSDADSKMVNISDDSPPVPIISVNGQIIVDEITILTGQRILFDATRTSDNVPISNLDFTWDWGDSTMEGGIGVSQASHMWADGPTWNTTYDLTLYVNDSVNIANKTIKVHLNNRNPGQIFNDLIVTDTYTATMMPDVFEDEDGQIVAWQWDFSEGVNLDGGVVDRTDLFVDVLSVEQYPMVAWNSPGMKYVNITVTDDDGGMATAMIQVQVLNQLPIADFIVKGPISDGSPVIDFRVEDGEVDVAYTFDGRASNDPDGSTGDSSESELHMDIL